MRNNYDGLTRMQWRKKQPSYIRWQRAHNIKLRKLGYFRKRYKRLKKHIKAQGNAYRERVRIDAFAHYGTTCYCCGEQNHLFLSLGHKNNDGAKHRKRLNGAAGKTGTGYAFYLWLKKNKYPPLPLQVECYNCNCGKTRNRGICPHSN